jgi:ankyrin repeat protein
VPACCSAQAAARQAQGAGGERQGRESPCINAVDLWTQRDEYGATPLHLALLHGEAECAALLLEASERRRTQGARRAREVDIDILTIFFCIGTFSSVLSPPRVVAGRAPGAMPFA